jgi:hypothetical protein
MKKHFILTLVLLTVIFVGAVQVNATPPAKDPHEISAAEIAAGTSEKYGLVNSAGLAATYSGAAAEVADEGATEANFDGDTTHAVSQDDHFDYSAGVTVLTEAEMTAALAGSKEPIIVNNTITLTGDLDASGKDVIVVKGGSFDLDSGAHTLTLPSTFDAGDYLVFQNYGSGTITGLSSAKAAWFGTTGAALQAATDALASGGDLYLTPQGSYTSVNNWQLKKYLKVHGNFATLTGSGASYVVSAVGTTGATNAIEALLLENLFIVPGATNTDCLFLTKLMRSSISNILVGQKINDATGADSANGLHIYGEATLGSYYNNFSNILARNVGGKGIYIEMEDTEAAALINANTFTSIKVAGVTGNGVELVGAAGNVFNGLTVEDCTGYAISLDNTTGGAAAQYNMFKGFWQESNTAGSLEIDANATGNQFYLTAAFTIPDAAKTVDGTIFQQGAGQLYSEDGFITTGGVFQAFDGTDANPTVSMTKDGLYFGAGGESAVDIQFLRRGANRLGMASGDILDLKNGGNTLYLGETYYDGDFEDVASGTNAVIGHGDLINFTGSTTITNFHVVDAEPTADQCFIGMFNGSVEIDVTSSGIVAADRTTDFTPEDGSLYQFCYKLADTQWYVMNAPLEIDTDLTDGAMANTSPSSEAVVAHSLPLAGGTMTGDLSIYDGEKLKVYDQDEAERVEIFLSDGVAYMNHAGVSPVRFDIYSPEFLFQMPPDADGEINLQAGTTGDYRNYFVWRDYNGSDMWKTGRNASNQFVLFDVTNSTHRWYFTPNGKTDLQSGGSGAVEINNMSEAGAGTGGLDIYSGGDSPALLHHFGSDGATLTGPVTSDSGAIARVFSQADDPDENDDEDNFLVEDVIHNTTDDTYWRCNDNTDGAADWDCMNCTETVTDGGTASVYGSDGSDNWSALAQSGSDGTIISGTAGDSGDLVEWDTNGDAIGSGSTVEEIEAAARVLDDNESIAIYATPDGMDDGEYNGITISGLNFGSTATAISTVFLASDGKVDDANATQGTGLYPAFGLAVNAGNDTDAAVILVRGVVRDEDWSGLTVGGFVYLGETAGTITQTAPSTENDCIQIIGWALSDSEIYFDFSRPYQLVGAE